MNLRDSKGEGLHYSDPRNFGREEDGVLYILMYELEGLGKGGLALF